MPPKVYSDVLQVSDWLMKGMVDEEEEDDIDSETGSMMRKISSPRSSNQVDLGHDDDDCDCEVREINKLAKLQKTLRLNRIATSMMILQESIQRYLQFVQFSGRHTDNVQAV